MVYLDYQRSFIASVQCTTPDYCGYWDCAELEHGAKGVQRRLGDWLTVHNLAQPRNHLFRFDCWFDERGYRGYSIESYSKAQGRAWSSTGIRFGFSATGYVALYPVLGPPTAFWRPALLLDGRERELHEHLRVGTISGAHVRSPDGWTLKALQREVVGDYWHVYANDADGPTMMLSLHIYRLGFEDLDDH